LLASRRSGARVAQAAAAIEIHEITQLKVVL
jgi:hypothetical protein